jgi:hypothetical protein
LGDAVDRRKVTFAQAEGAVSIPSQLKTKQISSELRAKLWRTIYVMMDSAKLHVTSSFYIMGDPWKEIMQSWHVDREHKPYDEFNKKFEKVVEIAKIIIFSKNYISVFDFVQFVLRHRKCPKEFKDDVDRVLQDSRAAYRVIDDTILPISDDEEVEVVRKDLAAVRGSKFVGTYAHLQSASSHLSRGDFAGTVRESIHAVESACRQLEPQATTLGPALKKLDERGLVHPSLKDAFLKLYGYSSDEEGVRHALVLKDSATVEESEALFMFSACTAFVGYLSRKAN